jgi:uncharacterized membrane protein
MATATKRLSEAGKAPAKAKKAAKTAKVVEKVAPSPGGRLARKIAVKMLKRFARRALASGEGAVRAAVERATEAGAGGGLAGSNLKQLPSFRQLPIQRSVDVAVPIQVAWEEWMRLDRLPEGIQQITDIERNGDELSGYTAGPQGSEWFAEILDERPRQSFAWRSYEGTDCAGLLTFHRLSKRLTRLELSLDVVPTSVAEAVALATHVADHRAETDLRRLKARLELISPDEYEARKSDS